jgi:hypothetical protein
MRGAVLPLPHILNIMVLNYRENVTFCFLYNTQYLYCRKDGQCLLTEAKLLVGPKGHSD